MTAQTHTAPDANSVLMGGGGPPAAKFTDPGTTIAGTITSPPQSFQEREYDPNNPGGGALKYFPSGDPIYGISIDIKTDTRDHGEDDGVRRIYVQGKRLKDTIAGAVRGSGSQKLEVGAHLTVTFTHREDPTDKRSAKYYTAVYTPAGNVALMGAPTTEAPATQQAAASTPTPQAAAPAGPAQPTAEQLAAVRSAGVDPKAAFPHWNGQG